MNYLKLYVCKNLIGSGSSKMSEVGWGINRIIFQKYLKKFWGFKKKNLFDRGFRLFKNPTSS